MKPEAILLRLIKMVNHKHLRKMLAGKVDDCVYSYTQAIETFEDKYGELPPTFIIFSPTQKCNLTCIGCYASSAANTPATISYSYKVQGKHFFAGCF